MEEGETFDTYPRSTALTHRRCRAVAAPCRRKLYTLSRTGSPEAIEQESASLLQRNAPFGLVLRHRYS